MSRNIVYLIIKLKDLLIDMCIIVLFVEKLFIMNVRCPERCGVIGTTLAVCTSMLSLVLALQVYVARANLAQKGHRQA